MPAQCKTVLYPVKDVARAKELFTALFGAGPYVDAGGYVGFSVDGTEVGLLPEKMSQGMTGPVAFFDVDDIAATLGALESAGAHITQQPTDVGYGLLVAKVVDVDGNDIGLRQQPNKG
jgi:predicted enzyme related to lactoylglutathione lyase